MGNHIDVVSGKWTAQDAGIGAGVDSYFEYLLKGGILFGSPRLIDMFKGNVQNILSVLATTNSNITLHVTMLFNKLFPHNNLSHVWFDTVLGRQRQYFAS